MSLSTFLFNCYREKTEKQDSVEEAAIRYHHLKYEGKRRKPRKFYNIKLFLIDMNQSN